MKYIKYFTMMLIIVTFFFFAKNKLICSYIRLMNVKYIEYLYAINSHTYV